MTDLERYRERLEAERAVLGEGAEARRDERGPEALDPSRVGRLSRMDAMQVRAMAGATEQRRQVRLARIGAALERIASGEFGECLHCGEPIAERRLELDPTVMYCIHCAETEA